jgi:putative two-component system response regulator
MERNSDSLGSDLPKILVIDDDEDNVAVLKYVLRKNGYEQTTAVSDPCDAVDAFLTFRPDLVLLDVRMAPIDGFEVLNRLKPHVPKTDYLPIVMLTGDESPHAKKRALESGAIDFVNKSFDHTEMLLRVRNLLQTQELYRQVQRHNEQLEERVRERTRELELAQEEILERLALAAEFRDDATGEHTKRVSEMSEKIGRQMGLPDDYCNTLRPASLLHDLGKIGIPDSILHNSAKLTPEQFDFVKNHTEMGGKILAGCHGRLLMMARDIALSHHEAWDGSGYPRGLAGEVIPLAGRIVAVADVFDALLAARPYKAAFPLAEAVQAIRLDSGSRFDPRVVDAFLAVIREEAPTVPAPKAALR